MGFLQGKRVLILGLLSDRSIAYGIASAMKQQGAELAFTYQMDKHQGRVEKLAANFDSNIVLPCDVSNDIHIEQIFPKLSSVDILPYVNSEAGVLPSKAPYVFSSPTIVPSMGAVLILTSGKKDFAQLPQ